MKSRRIVLLLAGLLAAAGPARPNGLNLNSLGARAMGMGGATIALADDFSAIFWNPAGLARIRRISFGFFGTDVVPYGSYQLAPFVPGAGTLNLADSRTNVRNYLGFLSAYVCPLNSDLVGAIGVYTPSGAGVSWRGSGLSGISGGNSLDWSTKIGLITISPAIAWRISGTFSIGAALNLSQGIFDLSSWAGSVPISPAAGFDLGQYSETESGWGLGATLGVQFQATPRLRLGATLRTASVVKFSGQAEIKNFRLLGLAPDSDIRRDVTWPLWIGAGIAYAATEALTITADVQYTQWSRLKRIATTFDDPNWSLLMAASGRDVMDLQWSDSFQVRVGAELRMSPSLVLRAGYYHDPSSAPDRTSSILLPSFNFDGVTLGAGYQLGELRLEFALEWLLGGTRSVDAFKVLTDPAWKNAMPGVTKMAVVVPGISVSYRF